MGRIEVNGRTPAAAELAFLAQVNYGHFTSMQVSNGAVRGFARHLDRLAAATRELFGSELDTELLRGWIRQVLDDQPESLRVTVFSTELDRARLERAVRPDVLVATSPARIGRSGPLRLQCREFERDLPHIKHLGTFSLFHHWRQARLAGFDDVLFRTRSGEVSEGSTWNIGFWDGQQIVWPTAPALPGVTKTLLEEGLHSLGVEMRSRAILAAELAGFRSAFVMNSGWVGPLVRSVDEHAVFEEDAGLVDILGRAYGSRAWEPV